MKLQNLTKVTCLLAGAALFARSLSAAAPLNQNCTCLSQADWNFPSEASQLLQEIRSASHSLTANTSRLLSFTHRVSWQGHAGELALVREQVNDVGERIQRLQAIRHALEPWQQQAIDAITPAAVSVASGTEAAIQYLNENRNFLWAETYKGHLKTLSSGADLMKQTVALHLELASTQEKLETLRNQVASLGS